MVSNMPSTLSDDEPAAIKIPQATQRCPYVVILSGTHVTGKETLAVHLSDSLGCPWVKAEMVHNAAGRAAKFQASKGYDFNKVFGRIWYSKLLQMGYLSESTGEIGDTQVPAPMRLGTDCTALITCYAMRKESRDALRDAMIAHSTRPVFVIMQITKETLSGRTLGAEEPELAEKIMKLKIDDIAEPLEEEKDVILIDSTQDVDAMFLEIKARINKQLMALRAD